MQSASDVLQRDAAQQWRTCHRPNDMHIILACLSSRLDELIDEEIDSDHGHSDELTNFEQMLVRAAVNDGTECSTTGNNI